MTLFQIANYEWEPKFLRLSWIYVCVYVCVYECVCAYIYIHMCDFELSVNICAYIYIYIYIYINVCVYVCVCVCVCEIYIYAVVFLSLLARKMELASQVQVPVENVYVHFRLNPLWKIWFHLFLQEL